MLQQVVWNYRGRVEKKRPKRFWKKRRSVQWWNDDVQNNFTDEDWYENFRMSKATFVYICKQLTPYLKADENWVRQPNSVENKVTIALYKLASCGEYRMAANQFGTHKTVVGKYVHDVCEAIYAEFREEYLSLPNNIEVEEISHYFQQMCGIPNVCGAIDGTHIPILPLKLGYRDFVNRKGWPSYNMIAVVDHMYRFRYVTCKHPGSVHDATVLKDSKLYMFSGHIMPHRTQSINGLQILPILLGDPAYPLLPWLMKGYTGNRTAQEESFNVYLSRGRVVVENAFGRLKARFRILLKRKDVNYKFVPNIVAACVILHNILETRKEKVSQKWLETVQDAEILQQPDKVPLRERDDYDSSLIRETLMTYMSANYPLLTSRL